MEIRLGKKTCCLCACVIILIISSMFLSKQMNHMNPRFRPPEPVNIKNKISTELESFSKAWCRERKARIDWETIIKPCRENIEWKTKNEGWGKENRTSALKSYVINSDIRLAGQYSRLFIQSVTASGRKKMIGGDSWRVYINGPSSLAASVFDHMDGTYEALFLVMEAGTYQVTIVLDYSLCDGIKEPPFDWFVKGNKHGKRQPEGMLGYLDDYLQTPLGKNPSKVYQPSLQIDVLPSNYQFNFVDYVPNLCICESGCKLFWDGFGRWNKNKWLPMVTEPTDTPQISQAPVMRRGNLFIYGDSLGLHLHAQMRGHAICTQLFIQCQNSYNWIYSVDKGEGKEMQILDDLEINVPKLVWKIQDILRSLQKIEGSVLLINAGLHFTQSTNFHNYMVFIDNLSDVLKSAEEDKKNVSGAIVAHKVKVLWKTTAAIRKEHGRWLNSTNNRFMNYPRVQLFNAYATARMCQAGIEVVDVFPLTASYPSGTLPGDVVHYSPGCFNTLSMPSINMF